MWPEVRYGQNATPTPNKGVVVSARGSSATVETSDAYLDRVEPFSSTQKQPKFECGFPRRMHVDAW